MKIVVAVVVLASCTVQMVFGSGNLDGHRNEIARQKIAVQDTVYRLQRHKLSFSTNLNNDLSDAKMASMREISSIVNSTLTTIKDVAKESTYRGKNAAQCFKTARARLGEYSLTGDREIKNCCRDALRSVSRDEVNMDSTILGGQQVLTSYDSIFRSCSTSHPQEMDSCIKGLLTEGARVAQAFQTTTDIVISSSSSAAKTALAHAINCMNIPVGIVRQGASQVRLEANRCIASL